MNKEKKAAYDAAYYEAHKEERVAYSIAYYEAHKEERAAYYKAHKEKRAAYCEARKDEIAAYRVAYNETHKDEAAAREVMRRYKISRRDAKMLVSLRDGEGAWCDICRTIESPFNIDHDHKTGKIRGILCGPCNRSIEVFDNEFPFQAAIEYLGLGGQQPLNTDMT